MDWDGSPYWWGLTFFSLYLSISKVSYLEAFVNFDKKFYFIILTFKHDNSDVIMFFVLFDSFRCWQLLIYRIDAGLRTTFGGVAYIGDDFLALNIEIGGANDSYQLCKFLG